MPSGRSLSRHELSSLIGAIYDCALVPSKWDEVLVSIRSAFSAHNATLHLTDTRHHQVLINRQIGMEPRWQQVQLEHLPEIHARLGEALASWRSLDDPHLISRHMTAEYIAASPYFQQCLKPQGIVDVLQYFLITSPTRLAGFGMGRHEQAGVFTDSDIELGTLLIPHIRRAVTISDVLDVRSIERERMKSTLDALRCAIFLTDGSGAILHANQAGEELLRRNAPVSSVHGRLVPRLPSAAAELRTAIALASRNEAEIGKAGLAVRLTEDEATPALAHVLPLTGSDLRTRLQAAAVAAVFIAAPPDEQSAADAAANAFGLTEAETRVLSALMAGQTLADAATTLGIARSTAKTHLDNIFSKTGVTRQADLIRLGSGLSAPVRQDKSKDARP